MKIERLGKLKTKALPAPNGELLGEETRSGNQAHLFGRLAGRWQAIGIRAAHRRCCAERAEIRLASGKECER